MGRDGRPLAPYTRPLNRWTACGPVRRPAWKTPGAAGCSRTSRTGNGRTLDENLQPLGKSASGCLLGLPFVDGSGLNVCRDTSVTMAATPGVQRVFVCPGGVGVLNNRLTQVEFRNGSLAEAMVIHEMLHTRGLGEDPPSTFEITRRVRERCR